MLLFIFFNLNIFINLVLFEILILSLIFDKFHIVCDKIQFENLVCILQNYGVGFLIGYTPYNILHIM